MKKMMLILTGLTLLGGLARAQTPPDDVTDFIRRFEKAVISHDYNGVMPFMDRTYVRRQHDKFLKKNTAQFIDEFMGGPVNADLSGEYLNILLADISGISLDRFRELGKDEYEVVFRISGVTGTTHYRSVLLQRVRKRLGFVGAMG